MMRIAEFIEGASVKAVIRKTFGGLSREYYLRQMFFGCIIAAFAYWLKTAVHGPTLPIVALIALNTLLYPYARFVWESFVNFITGGNAFILPSLVFLFVKAITMLACWQMAPLIAPIGLAWLYWHHSKQERLRD